MWREFWFKYNQICTNIITECEDTTKFTLCQRVQYIVLQRCLLKLAGKASPCLSCQIMPLCTSSLVFRCDKCTKLTHEMSRKEIFLDPFSFLTRKIRLFAVVIQVYFTELRKSFTASLNDVKHTSFKFDTKKIKLTAVLVFLFTFTSGLVKDVKCIRSTRHFHHLLTANSLSLLCCFIILLFLPAMSSHPWSHSPVQSHCKSPLYCICCLQTNLRLSLRLLYPAELSTVAHADSPIIQVVGPGKLKGHL